MVMEMFSSEHAPGTDCPDRSLANTPSNSKKIPSTEQSPGIDHFSNPKEWSNFAQNEEADFLF